MRRSLPMLILFIAAPAWAAEPPLPPSTLPPLSDDQKRQLDAVVDGDEGISEDAFYSLMQNAVDWDAGETLDAPKLDYDAVFKTPADARGELLLIEGEYVSQHELYRVQRAGPWSGKLEQWGIEVGENKVVMVYLVKPPPAPVRGDGVRLVARFYKRFLHRDGDTDETKEYLVFVGRSAEVMRGEFPPALTEAQRLRLKHAQDYTNNVEDAAMDALIQNVSRWNNQTDPLGPLVSYAEPFIAEPNEYRGMLVEIAGVYVGAKDPLKIQLTTTDVRQVAQWGIKINDDREDVVMVALVNPPSPPRPGDRVRIAARFYKVWRDYNQLNEPRNYPYFVGYSTLPASHRAAASRGGGGVGAGDVTRYVIAAVAAVALAFFMARRFMKRAAASASPADVIAGRRAFREKQREQGDSRNGDEEKDTGPPLPEDPIAALEELERRKAEA